jgi:hypothetical protein
MKQDVVITTISAYQRELDVLENELLVLRKVSDMAIRRVGQLKEIAPPGPIRKKRESAATTRLRERIIRKESESKSK